MSSAGILGPVNDFLGTSVPTQPGVGGARPQDAWALQPIPGTNYSYDPVTGQTYLNGTDGTQVAAAPNLAQVGAGAQATQQGFLGQQAQAVQQAAATRAGQGGLAADYLATIAGRTPSVAGLQLSQGLNQIGQQQQSQAAAANGQNAFAARRAAAMNTARAGIDANGQAAILRAGETNAARTGLANLYGQESQADTAANKIASDTSLGYGNLTERAIGDREGVNQKAQEDNAKNNQNLFGKGISALGSLL